MHMMGPSKACFADTPRKATFRTTEDAKARARSQAPVKVHPSCLIPPPFWSMFPGATALRARPDRVGSSRMSALLPHAPLLH